jgi:hypothetical protein
MKKRRRKRLGEEVTAADIKSAAVDMFLEGKIARGEQVLDELPVEQRDVARCVRAKHPQPSWGQGAGTQQSLYQLYKPIIDAKGREHHVISVSSSKTYNEVLITPIDPRTVERKYPIVDFSAKLPNEYTKGTTSHREALKNAGYSTVVPCANVALSGRRVRRRSRR